MLEANFWQDKENSKKVIKEKKLFEDLLNTYKISIGKLSDLNDLSELALEEKNEPIQKEVLLNIKELRTLVKKNEVKCFLSNEADSLDCYIEIHAGAGVRETDSGRKPVGPRTDHDGIIFPWFTHLRYVAVV